MCTLDIARKCPLQARHVFLDVMRDDGSATTASSTELKTFRFRSANPVNWKVGLVPKQFRAHGVPGASENENRK